MIMPPRCLATWLAGFLVWTAFLNTSNTTEAADSASPIVVYDLSAVFSTNANPAGPWAYGWKPSLSGAFTPFPLNAGGSAENGVLIWFWYKPVSPSAVYVNPSSTTATSDGGQGSFPPGSVWFYPGIEGNPDNYGAIRFSVPSQLAGNYQLEINVRSYLDGPGAGDTDFHIVHNGTEVFGQFLAARASTGFTNVLVLAGNDTIDFLIGRGADNRVHGSGLKIQATLTHMSDEPVPPIIFSHPQDQIAFVGTNVTFAVSAFGTPPLFYQWLYNSNAIPNQTNRSLTLFNVQGPEAGFYSVVVSNVHGAVTSQVAQLTITVPPPAEIIRGPYLQNASLSNIIIRWRTDIASESRIFYGTNLVQLSAQAFEPELTTEHAVQIDNLQAGTRYYYAIAVGTNVIAGPGPGYYFTTLPSAPKLTRIWALGDCGTGAFSFAPFQVRDAYIQFTGERETDVWLMLGDNAYGSGTDQEYQGAVFDVFTDLLRRNVLWSTLGNHETYGPLVNGQFAYFHIFNLPVDGRAGGVASGTENYYSFDYGNIHFVCMDSELSDKQPTGPMLTWLEQDLAANTKEWTIAFWHSPPYTKGSHDSDSPFDSAGYLIQMRENVVPVLENHGVDLVLCGHSHSYERSYLLDGHYGFSASLALSMIKDIGSGRDDDTGAYVKDLAMSATRNGAVYVVTGSAGQIGGGALNHPAMYISLNRLGSLVVDIDGSRLDGKFVRETGAIDDYFSIIKTHTPDPLRFATFRVTGGVLHAAFKTAAGRTYRIQKAAQLDDPVWTDASSDILATGATTRWSGPVANDSDHCFFRVVRMD